MEVWKAIEGFDGVYEVSSEGRVRSTDKTTLRKDGKVLNTKGKVLSTQIDHNGYVRIAIFYKGSRGTYKVHRLVAQAFLVNLDNKPNINHKNNNRSDNRVENLEWCTQKENMRHCSSQNRIVSRKGVNHVNAKVNNDNVREIRVMYRTGKYTLTELGNLFGLHFSTIDDIIKGRTWKHV